MLFQGMRHRRVGVLGLSAGGMAESFVVFKNGFMREFAGGRHREAGER